MTEKQIKVSLMQQLRLQGKTADFYTELANDYIYYWKLKKKLIADIKEKGIRYKTINGNGIYVEKENESHRLRCLKPAWLVDSLNVVLHFVLHNLHEIVINGIIHCRAFFCKCMCIVFMHYVIC